MQFFFRNALLMSHKTTELSIEVIDGEQTNKHNLHIKSDVRGGERLCGMHSANWRDEYKKRVYDRTNVLANDD